MCIGPYKATQGELFSKKYKRTCTIIRDTRVCIYLTNGEIRRQYEASVMTYEFRLTRVPLAKSSQGVYVFKIKLDVIVFTEKTKGAFQKNDSYDTIFTKKGKYNCIDSLDCLKVN